MQTRILYLVLLVAGLVAPLFVYEVFLMKLLCFALFAVAFNLLLGFGGLLSFGHAAFFGLAAYTTAHALKVWGLPTLAGIGLATGAAALLGLVFGLLAIRRHGIYFAMITLALAQMVYFVFLQAPFTGGEDGVHGVPRGTLLGLDLSSNLTLYYVVLGFFIAGYALVYRIVHSPFGQVIGAIRQNPDRAVSLGYSVDRYKLLVFVLSAALSGTAGALKTVVFRLASLSDAHWHLSGEVVLMTLIGGLGTLLGPLAGAVLVVSFSDLLAGGAFRALVPVMLGTLFVVCVIFFRRGLVGEVQHWLRKRRLRGA